MEFLQFSFLNVVILVFIDEIGFYSCISREIRYDVCDRFLVIMRQHIIRNPLTIGPCKYLQHLSSVSFR